MRRFLTVFKREYAQVVKKKSFIVGIFLTPALMAAFTVLPAMLIRHESSDAQKLAVIDQSGADVGARFAQSLGRYTFDADSSAMYIVDSVYNLPAGDSAAYNRVYDSLAAAINDKQLKYFLVVRPNPQDADSNVFLVTNSDNFRTLNRFEARLSDILASMRLKQSNVNMGVDSVISLTRRLDLATRDAKGESLPFQVKYFTALVMVGLMFGMIFGYGQLVMRSVIEEKNSRIMEVLVSSVSPFQLMLGKVLGLGAATLTQIFVWVLLGAGIYTMKGALNVDPSIDRILFNPAIVIFFVLYMISGYLLFSTLFALIGSVVNTEKEAQNFVMPISLMLVLPFMIAIYIVQEPNSAVSVVLSLIPFLAPTLMTMRVVFIAPTMSSYSLFGGIVGEAALGLIIVWIAIVALVWLTSKIFRVGILMYGKRPTLPEIAKWVRYK